MTIPYIVVFRPSDTMGQPAPTNPATPIRVLPQQLTSPLQQAALAFRLSRQAQGCTRQTLIWYDKYVPPLISYLESLGVKDAATVNPGMLRQYIVSLQARDLAPRTVHHHASASRVFFRFLESDGMIDQNPMAKVKMPRLSKDILPAFTTEDAAKLLVAANCTDHAHRDVALLLCLLDSGARSSEFVALNAGDVDLKTGSLMIRLGKGRKDRVTYLGARARKALLRYLMDRGQPSPGEPLWLSQTRERLTADGLRQLLDRVGSRASVAHCHPHTFRRTFALWSLRAGMNIFALQQLMGHSDLTVLQKYLALVTEDLQTAHAKYGAVDNMLPRRG